MEALLIKIPEVAARLGVSRAKVYELIAAHCRPSRSMDAAGSGPATSKPSSTDWPPSADPARLRSGCAGVVHSGPDSIPRHVRR